MESNLVKLSIARNSITFKGVKELSKMFARFSKLEAVNLSHNPI